MKQNGRAFTESFLLHGLLAGTFIVMIGMMRPPLQTIRLDFNMFDQQIAAPAPKAEQKVAEQPAPAPKPEPVQEKIKQPPPKPQKRTPSVAAVQPLPAPAAETSAITETSDVAETRQEQTASPPGPTVPADEAYRRANFGAIRASILANLQYPMLARRKGWSGKVEVAFLIKPDGNISELRIQSSSGYPVLDDQALEAIRRSAPFTPPNVAALLVMPVTFQLN